MYEFTNYHGLYGSTSCCTSISHGPRQWEREMFDPHSSETPGPIFMKLEIYVTSSRTRPRMQNFRGLCRRGWSGQIASLTHESFCPFFVASPRPQVAFLDTSQRSVRHYASVPPRKCLLGVTKIKFKT